MESTASTRSTKSRAGRLARAGGFTLVELLVASALSLIVFAAIFSTYIFVAKNLTRLVNSQQQFKQQRGALYQLARDAGNATSIENATVSSMDLKWNYDVLNPTTHQVDHSVAKTATYTYTAATGVLQRTEKSVDNTGTTTIPATLMTNLSSLTFRYYTKIGVPSATGIGQLEVSFSSAVGDSRNGTQSGYSTTSSRLVLRNIASTGP